MWPIGGADLQGRTRRARVRAQRCASQSKPFSEALSPAWILMRPTMSRHLRIAISGKGQCAGNVKGADGDVGLGVVDDAMSRREPARARRPQAPAHLPRCRPATSAAFGERKRMIFVSAWTVVMVRSVASRARMRMAGVSGRGGRRVTSCYTGDGPIVQKFVYVSRSAASCGREWSLPLDSASANVNNTGYETATGTPGARPAAASRFEIGRLDEVMIESSFAAAALVLGLPVAGQGHQQPPGGSWDCSAAVGPPRSHPCPASQCPAAQRQGPLGRGLQGRLAVVTCGRT